MGSSAGSLIGLQFVVMALVADRSRTPEQAEAGNAFATIVHFATVLLLSAALSAPWHAVGGLSLVWGRIGLCGLVYAAIVTRRERRQTAYQPVFEDWLFHALLPLAAMLAASAWEARAYAHQAMFGVTAAARRLLFLGIHNAWDAATYHIFVNRPKREEAEQPR